MAETCMFCLDEVKSTEVAFNPIGCQCEFKSHGPCLQSWFEQKGQYECPICHTVSIPSPVQQPPIQQVPVQVIYVQNPTPTIDLQERCITRGQERCLSACCLGFLFWSVFVTVWDMFGH